MTLNLVSSLDDVIVTEDLTLDPEANQASHPELHRLPSSKLKNLLRDTERRLKEMDAACQHHHFKSTTRSTLSGRFLLERDRRPSLHAARFSLQDGWDFTRSSNRMAVLRRLRDAEPNAVLLRPACRLWSQLLSIAAHILAIRRNWKSNACGIIATF